MFVTLTFYQAQLETTLQYPHFTEKRGSHKSCHNPDWKCWKDAAAAQSCGKPGERLCLNGILIMFLQSVDTVRNSSEQVHLLCTKPTHRRRFMFTAPRQQNNETENNSFMWEESQGCSMVWNMERIYFQNNAQWLNFPFTPALKNWHLKLFRRPSLCWCRWKQGRNHAASTFLLANSGMTSFLRQLQLWMTAFYLLPAN